MAEITYVKRVKIGTDIHEFHVKGADLHEVIKPLSFGNVSKCGICGSSNLRLNAHVAQGKFKYTTVKCGNCGASLNFGQQQEDSSITYLKTRKKPDGKKEYDWQSYTSQGQVQAPQASIPQHQNLSHPPQGGNYPPQQ